MPPAISRRAVILLSVAGAMALLLASMGIGDWWVRNREMRTLLGRVEQAERAQVAAIRNVGPLLLQCRQEPNPDNAEQCDTVGIRQSVERFLPPVQQTGDDVAGTRLTSFHGSLRSFRDRYVIHYMEWRTWLESLTRDPTAGGFRLPDTINSTFVDANDAADRALTPFPLHGNRTRVEGIFAAVR